MSLHPAIGHALINARMGSSRWAQTDFDHRTRILNAFADQLRMQKTELSRLISDETGKPRWESATEVDAMINKVALSIRAQAERRATTSGESAGVKSVTRYK